jgi:hypothetical protein
MKMRSVFKTVLVASAMATTLGFAQLGNAAPLNPSFESPDASNGDIGGSADWVFFNGVFTTSNNYMPGGGPVNPNAHSGTQVLKQFGADGGALQRVAAAAGDKVDASVYAMNWAGDPFGNLFILEIGFFDQGGGNIGTAPVFADPFGTQQYDLQPQDGADLDDWTQMVTSAIAPDGTAEAQILLIHIATGGSGAIFLDDASLTVSQVPVPAAAWLFGSALMGLVGLSRRRQS